MVLSKEWELIWCLSVIDVWKEGMRISTICCLQVILHRKFGEHVGGISDLLM